MGHGVGADVHTRPTWLLFSDHSNANVARWCSMAICGNRLKARRHYQQARTAPGR